MRCHHRLIGSAVSWMPVRSSLGWMHGVFRHWMWHYASTIGLHDACRFCAKASVCCRRLHAYRRGTRRKHVRVGSYAASMPRKIPRRHACKHLSGFVGGCRIKRRCCLPISSRKGWMQPRELTIAAHDACRFCAKASVCCGRLHAHRRGTRRKYVHVGSYAASMPRKVPRRHACKHLRRVSVLQKEQRYCLPIRSRERWKRGVVSGGGTMWRHGCRH
ncbi:hypothetical protein LMG31884_39240 [Xanthomonas hydrangeae]|nr:hypothetical protein LMG31884_39240 [Xanthomonas hydrangeae]CAD7726134.1 hypothetical protein LMG31884_39240 [Xanthomonas hydrangeae]CAD7742357.1 hypothetical protein LMG31887_39160 [Xanthomonas hydrangeae]CAD7742360.1 hypothetical protein LMG31887_39160 [Xanthomonas hydrangeae]